MATMCPTGFDATRLRDAVKETYERVARNPETAFHFNMGLEYAVNLLRYDRSELEALPGRATARFAGVGNPHRAATIREGEVVVDIGSGGGTDLLLAAKRVGPNGRAIGIDPTQPMREALMASARDSGLDSRVVTFDGTSEDIPLPDKSVDVVMSNGVLNLALDKRRAIREIYRILAPGGRVYLADVFLGKDLKEGERSDPSLWAGCVAGALLENEIIELAREAGFEDAEIVERFDCFGGSRVETNVSTSVGVHGANFIARKGRPQ